LNTLAAGMMDEMVVILNIDNDTVDDWVIGVVEVVVHVTNEDIHYLLGDVTVGVGVYQERC